MKDTEQAPLAGRTIAIIGYGSQGRAQAQNLNDRGLSVIAGLRKESETRRVAAEDGIAVHVPEEAARIADIIVVLTPDEVQPALYRESIAPALRPGKAIAFGHGFAIHHGLIEPPPDIDVWLCAPVGPGVTLRRTFVGGTGIPAVIAVHQDASGTAWAQANSYAHAIGCGRKYIARATFREEVETDLFGEQAVICGGVSALMRAGFEVLTEAGYPDALAYFECIHQMKLLVDLIHERGIAGMRDGISNTAKYGDVTRGPRVIDESTKQRMRKVLEEVQSGAFAKAFMDDVKQGAPERRALLEAARKHPLEATGARLRAAGTKTPANGD